MNWVSERPDRPYTRPDYSRFARKDDPAAGAKAGEKPGTVDRLVGHVLERNDLVDPESCSAQLALQLAPAIEVDFHAVDAPVGHPAVAHISLKTQGPAELAQQPETALRVVKIEPEVMHVQG